MMDEYSNHGHHTFAWKVLVLVFIVIVIVVIARSYRRRNRKGRCKGRKQKRCIDGKTYYHLCNTCNYEDWTDAYPTPTPTPTPAPITREAYREWETYDGSANNMRVPTHGMRGRALRRQAAAQYQTAAGELVERGPLNPEPRTISNRLCQEPANVSLNSARCSDMLWAWGQFLDHEIDLTHTDAADPAPMTTPSAIQDPLEPFPDRTIPFNRSVHVVGADSFGREHPNDISSFIDATNVYGFSSARSMSLRRLDGSGKLKTSVSMDGSEVLLVRNDAGLDNANEGSASAANLFVAGDVRANENALLTGMHTLFAREHNYWCDRIVADKPEWTGQDELIFQHARRILVGEMQVITFDEFLPALLGPNSVTPYTGYDDSVQADVSTEFSTAAYRFGHSAVSSFLLSSSEGGGEELVPLRDVFFRPSYVHENGVDRLLLGSTRKVMREIDLQIVDDLRSFLFHAPTPTQLIDLASLNIQRGRDHGLPGYNDVRAAYGLERKTSFAQVTSNAAVASALQDLYGAAPDGVDHIDPWVGCLAEDHIESAQVGELALAAIADQFQRLRDGDRFYFENSDALSDLEKQEIRNTRLADVLRRNTQWSDATFADDVFHVA